MKYQNKCCNSYLWKKIVNKFWVNARVFQVSCVGHIVLSCYINCRKCFIQYWSRNKGHSFKATPTHRCCNQSNQRQSVPNDKYLFGANILNLQIPCNAFGLVPHDWCHRMPTTIKILMQTKYERWPTSLKNNWFQRKKWCLPVTDKMVTASFI